MCHARHDRMHAARLVVPLLGAAAAADRSRRSGGARKFLSYRTTADGAPEGWQVRFVHGLLDDPGLHPERWPSRRLVAAIDRSGRNPSISSIQLCVVTKMQQVVLAGDGDTDDAVTHSFDQFTQRRHQFCRIPTTIVTHNKLFPILGYYGLLWWFRWSGDAGSMVVPPKLVIEGPPLKLHL
jgi:hypothetical protein